MWVNLYTAGERGWVENMINFRKAKQDFSPSIVKEGKGLHKRGMVEAAKIVTLTADSVRLNCSVRGNYDNSYVSEIEICRSDSSVIDSDCDCPYNYDCQHLAAILHYLEEHFDSLVVDFSKEADLDGEETIDEEEREQLKETFKQAERQEGVRKGKKYERELLEEYTIAAEILGGSPFFQPEEILEQDKAELLVILSPGKRINRFYEARLALRMPFRSKPLNILKVGEFIDAVRYHEAVSIGNRRFFFGLRSFDTKSAQILKMIMDFARLPEKTTENNQSFIYILPEALGGRFLPMGSK